MIWKKLETDPELIELERRSLEAAADAKVALWWEVNGERKARTEARSWPQRMTDLIDRIAT